MKIAALLIIFVLAAVAALLCWACLMASSFTQDRGDSIGREHSRK